MSYEEFLAAAGVGMKVEHQVFGRGTLTEAGENALTVRFENGQEKRFKLPYAYEAGLLHLQM